MPIPEWMKSPKGMAFIGAGIAVPVGIGAFYIYKLRQTIVTVTMSSREIKACGAPVTITATVTDGFGRPRAFEPVRWFVDGVERKDWAGLTDPAGKHVLHIWVPCGKSPHQDTTERFSVTFTAVARDAAGSATGSVVFEECTNFSKEPDTTKCPKEYPYPCPGY
jgi:hypothetical protein